MEGSKGGGEDGTWVLCPTSQGAGHKEGQGSCLALTPGCREVGRTPILTLYRHTLP